jgi:hypothetical protein
MEEPVGVSDVAAGGGGDVVRGSAVGRAGVGDGDGVALSVIRDIVADDTATGKGVKDPD